MSNAAAITILAAFAVSIAAGIGMDPVPLVMAVASGSSNAFTIPTASSSIGMSLAAGYKFKDYVIMGTAVSVVCNIVNIMMIILVYGLM